MYKLLANEISKITKGQLILGDPEKMINGYAINSGLVKKGDLFLPLKGVNTDGHAYIKEAVNKGAAGYLYSEGEPVSGAFAIKVDNVLTSLQRLAISRRRKFTGKVIAITGSAGKTTTKDFLVSILKRKYNVANSPKNFNTDIGVPLTILNYDNKAEILVVEMGMRGFGQIKLLASLAQPDIGLITNISKTHIELLGSQENIAQAKAELIEALNEEKVVFLNDDDKWTPYFKEKAKCKVETYGLQSGSIKAKEITLDKMAMPYFKIFYGNNFKDVKLKVPGKHNIVNALAAAAVSIKMGLTLNDIAEGLAQAKISDWRMEIKKNDDIMIISDYYNASPQSVESAIETLSEINYGKRKIAVLGDMFELGNISIDEHYKIVKIALKYANCVFLVGRNMSKAGSMLGVNKVFSNSEELAKEINRLILPGDVILLKASRAMAFENLETKITEEHAFS